MLLREKRLQIQIAIGTAAVVAFEAIGLERDRCGCKRMTR